MVKSRLIKLLSKSKKYIVFNVFFQWLALICQISFVYSISRIIGSIIHKSYTNHLFIHNIILAIISIVLKIICDRLACKFSFFAGQDVKKELRNKLYNKILSLGSNYRDYLNTAEVLQISTEGVEQLEIYFSRYLPQLFYSLLAPITLFFSLSFIDIKSSIILLICVPLIPLSIVAVQKIAKKLLKKYWGKYTSLGNSFLENLKGLTTLKIYNADKRKADQMDKEAEEFRRVTMKVLMMQLNSISVMDIIAYGGASIGMISAAYSYFSNKISFENAFMIILLAVEFFIPLRLLGSFFHIAMNGMAASDKIFNILDIKKNDEDGQNLQDDINTISIKNLNFKYPNKDKDAIKDIDIDIYKGQFIALVGTSGCGKSTLANIISSKYRNYEGSIQINNIELKDIKREFLQKHICYISHNSYIFNTSIRENLLMANSNLKDEDMITMLKSLLLWEDFKQKDGLNTLISENASNISGGQRQRLALARGILFDADVYILDEASSNVDTKSEDIIIKMVQKLAEQKTIILISHRLANVVNADKIFMLEDGKIIEQGTHKELMSINQAYAKMFNAQLELESITNMEANNEK